ncbi:MAG: helix-turn-helix transcriptional regulator [Ruminococcus sp.]|nr:helix-turn-helix transcriptional regulator [Ruminococcus sp.]
MEIGSIGYDHKHDDTFVMDRPAGPGAWLFLVVRSDAFFRLGDRGLSVPAGSFLLISPTTPTYYRALEDVYEDDWFYFSMTGEEQRELKEMGLSPDTVYSVGAVEELSDLVNMMTYEHYSAEQLHERAEKYLMGMLWITAARLALKAERRGKLPAHDPGLTHLRTRIYTEPDNVGSVSDLAAEVSMSRSGLQHAYKRTFGVSIMTDIVRGRVGLAKRLLTVTSLNIEEISRRCGYSSAYVFMRQFKQITGFTPTQYRKSAKGEWSGIE